MIVCSACKISRYHDGIFCAWCGERFADLKLPEVVYFRGGDIHIELELRHPFAEGLLITTVELESVETGSRKPVPIDQPPFPPDNFFRIPIPIDETHRSISAVETYQVTLIVELSGRTMPPMDIGRVRYSPTPVVAIAKDPKSSKEVMQIKLSAAADFMQKVWLRLENDAVFALKALRLKTTIHPADEFRREVKEYEAPCVGELHELSADRRFQPVIIDFSEVYHLEDDDLLLEDLVFSVEVINRWNDDVDINAASFLLPTSFEVLELPRVQLGVWKSTEVGFALLVHNEAYFDGLRSNPTFRPSSARLSSVYSDYISEAELQQDADRIDRSGIEPVLEDLAATPVRKVRMRIPAGIRRRRRFSVFLNFPATGDCEYDIDGNNFRISVLLDEHEAEHKELLDRRVWCEDVEGGERKWLEEVLDLGPQKESKGFDIGFLLPLKLQEEQLVFDLLLERYNVHTGKTVDSVSYNLLVDCYHPRENRYPLAVDFGTTNTCVVGPYMTGENLLGEPTPYKLDYYHVALLEQMFMIPTGLAYGRRGGRQYPFIPDFFSPPKGSYFRFKIDLMKLSTSDTEDSDIGPRELASDFFCSLYELVQIYYEDRGCSSTRFLDVVASVPVSFSSDLKREIQQEIERALNSRFSHGDCEQVRFRMEIDEPIAALVYAYRKGLLEPIADKTRSPSIFGVIDIGGGTVDTALVLVDVGIKATLMGTGGSREVGGNTVDLWIYRRLRNAMTQEQSNQAAAVDLRNGNRLLLDPGNAHFKQEQTLAFEVSQVKEFFAGTPEEFNAEELLSRTDDQTSRMIIEVLMSGSGSTKNLAAKLGELMAHPDLRDVFFRSVDANAVEVWQDPQAIFQHLLFPFFTALSRKLLQILQDAFFTSHAHFRRLGSDRNAKLVLILAGNASKIGFVKELVQRLVEGLIKMQPYLMEAEVITIDEPKACVALGSYWSRQMMPLDLDRYNNPPFDLFIPTLMSVPSEEDRKWMKIIGRDWVIPIFHVGEKNLGDGEVAKYLLTSYYVNSLTVDPLDTSIRLSQKIGIDILNLPYDIDKTSDSAADKLLFVLDSINQIRVLAFSTKDHILESKKIQEISANDPNLEQYLDQVLSKIR